MRFTSRAGDERGAVAVLYSITMFLMLGLVAIVIDLGALKWDRRATQVTADLASTAGALSLLSVPGRPGGGETACRLAWQYFLTNTSSNSAADPCAAWASVGCSDPHSVVEATVDPYWVRITWPVPEGSPLLDGRFDAQVDGDPSGCDRIAVQIRRTRGFVFGALFQPEGTTGAAAVARATIEEKKELAAALVVLDPHNCKVIAAGGGGQDGAIHVFETIDASTGDPAPGIIAVDSDASAGDCSASNSPGASKAIWFAGGNSSIKSGLVDEDGNGVEDTDGTGLPIVRKGVIFNYALQTSNSAKSYNPTDVSEKRLAGGDTVPPLPGDAPVPSNRTTRSLWHHRYDCRDVYVDLPGTPTHIALPPCPGNAEEGVAPNSAYVTKLRAAIDSAATDPAAHGYNVLTGADCGPRGTPLTPGTPDHPRPNWWFACSLDIPPSTTLEVTGGNVVVTGSVDVQGTLSINANGSDDNWVYIAGDFTKAAAASLLLGNPSESPDPVGQGGTFVLLGTGPNTSGRIRMQGAEAGQFKWAAPYRGPFEDLALWTEYNHPQIDPQPHTLGGELRNMVIDGIYYMPNARFLFTGGGAMKQQRAQFIAYRLRAQGNGALRVRPDPSRARTQFGVVVRLLR